LLSILGSINSMLLTLPANSSEMTRAYSTPEAPRLLPATWPRTGRNARTPDTSESKTHI
jgi:hypothetical protein